MEEIDTVQTSIANFSKRLDDASTNRFNELRKCSFFDPIPSEFLAPIADEFEIKTFNDGDVITVEGETMSSFYVILFGAATVSHNGKLVGTIRGGECIGEGMFFASENLSRSASTIANGQVIVAKINDTGVDHLQSASKTYMDKALLVALFKKLQGANKKIEKLLG